MYANSYESMKYLRGLYLGAFAILLSSCGGHVYEEEVSFEGAEWPHSQVVEFEFEVDDTMKLHNMYLEIAHSAFYEYENLYCKIELTEVNGQPIDRVTSLELANGKTGDWFGTCSGEDCTYLLPLQTSSYFSTLGVHRMRLTQYTRKDTLPGIESMTLIVDKTETDRPASTI